MINTPSLISNKGFTLVELLIVIGILAVLSTATVLILNPSDMVARANDTRRLNDVSSVNQALALYGLRVQNPSYGDPTKVYISLPNTLADCTGSPSYSLPPLPTGVSYVCSTDANYRKINGTGWIPVDFTLMDQSNPLAVLPADPLNNASYYYTYVTGGSWELTAMLQSSSNHEAAVGDGGPMPGVYEVGNNLTLGPANRDLGLVGYWKFDENTLTTANDSSGKGNNGTLEFGTSWQSGSTCKLSYCVLFDGLDDRVTLAPSFIIPSQFSVSLWVRASTFETNDRLIDQGNSGPTHGFTFSMNTLPNRITFAIYNGTTGTAFLSTPTLNVNTLYHLVGTFDGSVSKLYLDGNKVAEDTSTAMSAPGATFTMGRRSGSANPFQGYLDDIKVYNRALSESEIKVIYSSAN